MNPKGRVPQARRFISELGRCPQVVLKNRKVGKSASDKADEKDLRSVNAPENPCLKFGHVATRRYY
jgi:hypothetical protein